MATATQVHTTDAGIADRLAAFWQSAVEAQAKRREYRITVRELRALPTRELSDLGIASCDIRRLARHAAYGN